MDSTNFKPIVAISALTSNDSPLLHLVAVAQTGVRFYFTAINLRSTSSTNQRPVHLQLVHVRLPPGFSANASAVRPKNVYLSQYRENTLVMVSQTTTEQNHLWCFSSDPFPFLPFLMEAYTIVPLDGPAWAIQEVTNQQQLSSNIILKKEKASTFQGDPPLVVRQHLENPRKFIILTAQGAHIICKLRPVDLLRELLIENKGPESENVKTYFQSQREDQACATCLILACLESVQNIQIAEWATRAFFMYGGEPKVFNAIQQQQGNITQMNATFNPGFVSTPMPAQRQTQMSPSQTLNTTGHVTGQGMFQQPQYQDSLQMAFSAKHDGLYLYVGRILRDLWCTPCCRKFTQDNKTYVSISHNYRMRSVRIPEFI